jgi:choline dehydrogenase-like flavoprotein
MRVTFDFHPDDVKTINWAYTKQLEILEAAGAKKTWVAGNSVEDNLPSTHLMGTCRMGNDPRHSVVDRYNRAHDVPNLLIVDGSSFVTAARQQPTATIQALAYRAADYAIQAAKKA